jgi:peptidoglycan/LPS O-acetylase OafA/YrhL
MKVIQFILALLPIPFLFHFYEYNSHLERQEATLLFPLFLLFIIIVGIQLRKVRLSLFLGINIIMTVISLILGYFFIVDNGSWFKPFGRDVAIIFISVIYILGQLIIRWISKALSTDK